MYIVEIDGEFYGTFVSIELAQEWVKNEEWILEHQEYEIHYLIER